MRPVMCMWWTKAISASRSSPAAGLLIRGFYLLVVLKIPKRSRSITPGSASDPSKEDVYVIDVGHKVIDKFSSTGGYLAPIAGTCEEAGEAPPSCHKFTAFNGLAGVAVDTKGVVWVETGEEHNTNPALDTFSDAQPNAYLASHQAITDGAVKPGLAVDSEDDFYLVYQEARVVAKFNSAAQPLGGEPGQQVGGVEGASGVAVDPATNDVYIDSGSEHRGREPRAGARGKLRRGACRTAPVASLLTRPRVRVAMRI